MRSQRIVRADFDFRFWPFCNIRQCPLLRSCSRLSRHQGLLTKPIDFALLRQEIDSRLEQAA
jgi:hypothetical protein